MKPLHYTMAIKLAHGEPLPMERILPESRMQLGCLNLEDAFSEKLITDVKTNTSPL